MAPGRVFILPRGNPVAVDHARALLGDFQWLNIETSPEKDLGFGLQGARIGAWSLGFRV